jgi:hypothetical protein
MVRPSRRAPAGSGSKGDRLATVSPTFAHVASFRIKADQTPSGREKWYLTGRVRHAFLAKPVASHPSTPVEVWNELLVLLLAPVRASKITEVVTNSGCADDKRLPNLRVRADFKLESLDLSLERHLSAPTDHDNARPTANFSCPFTDLQGTIRESLRPVRGSCHARQ